MSHYFFDSSAIVKRYVAETGTKWVRSITNRNSENFILVAHITQAEIVSGLMRRKREGAIEERIARMARLRVDLHFSREYRVIGLTKEIVQRAENLLELYALRTYDAIQLASALETDKRLVAMDLPQIIFVSADNFLLNIALQEKLATDNPNTRP
jgi:hypothetical protein